MISSYLNKNIKEFYSKLPILLRPLINLTIFYFLALQLGDSSTYFIFALSITILQLDLIITTNHHFFLIIRDNRLYDIIISRNNIYTTVLLEASFSLIYYIAIQCILTYLLTDNYQLMLLVLLVSFISTFIGLCILPITLKRKSFLMSSKIASVLLLFSCVLIPLDVFNKLSYIILFDIFTPIFEFISFQYFGVPLYVDVSLLQVYMVIDFVIVLVIFFISKNKLLKYII